MAILTRQQIDSKDDLPKVLVKVPEWGGSVYVRALTVGERLRLEEKSSTESSASTVVRLIAMCMCGADGQSLYGEDGIEALSAKSGDAITRVRDAALKVNKLTSDEVADVEKN